MRLGRSLTTDGSPTDRHRLSSAGGRDRATLPARIRRERRGGRSEAPPLQAGRDATLLGVSCTLNGETRSWVVLRESALHSMILCVRSDLQCFVVAVLLSFRNFAVRVCFCVRERTAFASPLRGVRELTALGNQGAWQAKACT